MARDKISELLQIKQRAGRYKRTPTYHDLIALKASWDAGKNDTKELAELVPIKIVSLLEVFLRRWLECLVDFGAPFLERASQLNLNIKYDFAIAKSLQGGSITFGELFSHSVSLSELRSICATFQKLLDKDLFDAIRNTRDSWDTAQNGGATTPIVQDVDRLRSAIGRLLEVRNILVHEFPNERPCDSDDIAAFLDNAIAFMHAADEYFSSIVYGDRPLTQTEMNRQAAAEHKAALEELGKICNRIKSSTGSDEIFDVQVHWNVFKEAEAERQAQRHLGGSIRPMLYSIAASQITRARIKELSDWVENSGG
ncbi:lysozyme inhibitor LprI family protein [Bradyrhizobium oligotrophicum]|uniref:lysozyme inhibitor LprI family protein n=1 Tax=Bradyrhizobium oligotrophicum TaxID=44255 RepID=UPI003EC0DEEA